MSRRIVKPKKRCCKSKPRCKRCPVVCRRLEKRGLAELTDDGRYALSIKLRKKQLRKARA